MWPHAAFLARAAGSAYHTHLRVPHLTEVVVTEPELVEFLAALPLLQNLSIADHRANHPVLVPNLCHLTCQSILKFDDNGYLNFLL
ncbi:hypothetical protein FB451DRAFT_1407910 [Mycena latifolia]|nr:hypothetical protein FB451DRAFT_1407910 [Mycena latifolia]